MAAITSTINILLPFTNPSTPIWQDVIHTLTLCTFLYFAPQIPWQRVTEILQRWTAPKGVYTSGDSRGVVQNAAWPGTEETVAGDAPQEDDGREDAETIGQRQQHHDNEEDERPPQQERFNLDPAAALNLNDDDQDDGAGPANAQPRPRAGVVGAKKAKALARRDRARAYNEFLRAQGDEQRRLDAEGQEEREAEARRERERREVVERKIEEQKAKERKERRLRLEKEQAQDRNDIAEVRGCISAGATVVDLNALAKRIGRSFEWVVDVVRKEGLLGFQSQGTKTLTMLTKSGHLVRIDEETMRGVYAEVSDQIEQEDSEGKVTWDQLGKILQQQLQAA